MEKQTANPTFEIESTGETITQEQLRQRFNPEGSMLRRQQKRMLEILLEVDRICRRHHIAYWLSSGTLIGAVRHKGYIPWDDDVDIEMLWPDYQRLMRILPKELPEHLALQSTDTDPNYYFFYAKVRDRRSYIEETNGYDRVWREQGLYIDIFPIYRQVRWMHMLSEKLQGHVYKIMNRCWEKDRGSSDPVGPATRRHLWKVRLITRVNDKLLFPVMRFIGRLVRADYIYGLGIPFNIFPYYDCVFPLTETEFEGHLLPVPRDAHQALTLRRGDYMKLPDIDNVPVHVGKIEIREDNP